MYSNVSSCRSNCSNYVSLYSLDRFDRKRVLHPVGVPQDRRSMPKTATGYARNPYERLPKSNRGGQPCKGTDETRSRVVHSFDLPLRKRAGHRLGRQCTSLFLSLAVYQLWDLFSSSQPKPVSYISESVLDSMAYYGNRLKKEYKDKSVITHPFIRFGF